MECSKMRTSSTKTNRTRIPFYRWSAGAMLLAVTAGAEPNPARASREPLSPTCRSADTTSAYLEGIIERIVSLTDSTSTVVRTALQLPQMSTSSVSLVTQSQTCSKAAAALDAAQGSVNPNRTMYVFKLGNTRYAVLEVAGSSDFGGAGANFVWYFTNKWAFLSSGLV